MATADELAAQQIEFHRANEFGRLQGENVLLKQEIERLRKALAAAEARIEHLNLLRIGQ